MRIPDLLALQQWLSPAFPVSGYAHSHGLEAALAEGRVRDADTTREWVRCVLERGAGPLDAWAVGAVMGGAEPEAVAATIRARAGSAERHREAEWQGAAFVATTTAMGMPPAPALPLAVAVGLRARGMAREAVVAAYLHAFASALVSAAVRLVPLGQSEGQRALAALHPVIAAVAAEPREAPPPSSAWLAEMDAMAHETLQPRLFVT